ncbi:hypothetical protein HDU82_003802, partial [Entophlyctis luteolus]
GVRNTTTVFDKELEKIRLPRFVSKDGILTPYDSREALGLKLLKGLENGRYFKDEYFAHLDLRTDDLIVFVTNNRVMLAKARSGKLEWEITYNDLQLVRIDNGGITLIKKGGQQARARIIPCPDQASAQKVFSKLEMLTAVSEAREKMSSLDLNDDVDAFEAVKIKTESTSATTTAPVQRLMIAKLILRNFKSYAGAVEIGPFHKNGSGKSNVIDALLFVFGFKAKKMRQGKLSDLIHKSANYSDLESGGVEVHFQEIVDLGEVESIALMKPKASTENDDGLLEYLEDIIGTAKYKEQIEILAKDLDSASEEREEKLHRLKIVEKEKAQLEPKKAEAEDFVKSENELIFK